MTVAQMLELARAITLHPRYADHEALGLARGVIELLEASFPCGWPEPVGHVPDPVFGSPWVEWHNNEFDIDEARGIAVAILKATDLADSKGSDQ